MITSLRDSIAAAIEEQKRKKTSIEYDARGKRQSTNVEDKRFAQQQKKKAWKPGDGDWPTPRTFPSGPFPNTKPKPPPPFKAKPPFPQEELPQKNPFPPGEGPPRRQIWRDEKRSKR